MEQDLKQKLDEMDQKIEETRRAVIVIKKIFIWAMVLAVVSFVLPLIGLAFVIPQFLSVYQGIGAF